MINNISKEIHLITYPRCGSTYLSKLLGDSFQKEIYRRHLNGTKKMDPEYSKNNDYYNDAGSKSFKENNYAITVLRNPVDSISSLCSMENFYNKNIDIDLNIKQYTEYYIYFFKDILKIVDLMIDFNDINIHKDSILKYVGDKTNNSIINKNYSPEILDLSDHQFLKSSKINKNYECIKEKVKNNDLTECFNVYNSLITECKNFK